MTLSPKGQGHGGVIDLNVEKNDPASVRLRAANKTVYGDDGSPAVFNRTETS